jgi:uncharacterized protein
MVDREAIRRRPAGMPMMYQVWHRLLFLHWRVSAEALRGVVPRWLTIDTYDGEGWIGITPFTMTGVRPVVLPALPGISRTHELNVRTYVHYEGVPGVWFFSLDASNPLAVLGARLGFNLPYHVARMRFETRGEQVAFGSTRVGGGGAIDFQAEWTRGGALGVAEPGSLEFFLTERYCLYAVRRGSLLRSRIHHSPWELREATLSSLTSTMLSGQGLPEVAGGPLVHAQGDSLKVEIWPLERVGTA